MNTNEKFSAALGIAAYQRAWTEAVCQVLEKLGAGRFTGEVLGQAESEAQILKLSDQDLRLQFSAVKPFTGEQAVVTSAADGVRLAQMLLGEPADGGVAMSITHRDAAAELIRQMAGATAVSLAGKIGKEVDIKFVADGRFGKTPAACCGLRFTDAQAHSFTLHLQLSLELMQALESGVAEAQTVETPRRASDRQAPARKSARDVNIDLLMDVELDVNLRFGECQLLLRNILELAPGAVVELDQKIGDPVELLVGKKVVARGEVVVVDGHYGLRVTEIASRQERLESLRG